MTMAKTVYYLVHVLCALGLLIFGWSLTIPH
jgi:hypothetical protein